MSHKSAAPDGKTHPRECRVAWQLEAPLTAAATRSSEARSYVERLIPMRRWGKAAELAEAILYLASPASSFTTGAYLTVDGECLVSDIGLSLGAAFCGVWVMGGRNLNQVEQAGDRFDIKSDQGA